ncbi:hypothetical protein Q5P01_002460 [Channa striata]|uniref:Uncharacterized protein n=1 Tax=Channa striata TaxID=64152 RepID=A0AA88NMM9_CHASR|nr:hypothetical protein Q5P01_002460 [Channa striata]
MKGDTGSSGADGDCEAATHATRAERRSSIATIQNMLKKVSQSPFHNEYKPLVSSSDSSFSPVNDSQNKKDDEFLFTAAATNLTDSHKLHLRQNGFKTEGERPPAVAQNGVQEQLRVSLQNEVTGGLTRIDPFYEFNLESGTKDHTVKDSGMQTSEEVDGIFAHSLDFQSTPLDPKPRIQTSENGGNFMQDPFQTSKVDQITSANGHFYDVTLNSPDLLKANSSHTQILSDNFGSKNSEHFKGEVDDLFQTAKEEDLFTGAIPQSTLADAFYSAKANEADLFQAGPTISEDPFQVKEDQQRTSLYNENLNIFSSSSINSIDPFPSPLRRDLFQDLSSLDDPFGTSPFNLNDPFQDFSSGTPDVFQPLPSKTNDKDMFLSSHSNTTSKATYSTLSLNSPSEMKLDRQSTPDGLKAAALESTPATPSESFNGQYDIVLTTPQGTKHDILQPTPFTRARNLAMLPNHSPNDMTRVSTFKRPPKPLPRIRPSRPGKPAKPEKPPKPGESSTPDKIEPEPPVPKTSPKPAFRHLPKPVISLKPKTQESKPLDPENYDVFEDVLLIGQERCVEDWPEDSPEINPDFKPFGKFRLRRESLKVKTVSDGGNREDLDGSGSLRKKKDKKFRGSLLSRRGSKNKFPDDTKEERSRTLSSSRKSSKEYFSEMSTLAGENEDGEQDAMDYKKKPQKTKTNSLLRRSSTPSSLPEEKLMNGHLPQESKGKVLDDSACEEEDGEAMHEEAKSHGFKGKKKMKIKFVPQRGFTITVQKSGEPKGAYGYTPRKGSKEKESQKGEDFSAHGYNPRKKSQDNVFEDVEGIKASNLQSTSKATFMDEAYLQKSHNFSPGLNGDEETFGMENCKPKKQTKMKLLLGRQRSKEDMLDDNSSWKKKSSISAEEFDDDELNGIEDGKPKIFKHKGPVPLPRTFKSNCEKTEQNELGFSHHTPQHVSSDEFEDEITGKDFMSPGEINDNSDDELEDYNLKKPSKLKGFKKSKAKSKAMYLEDEDPPGATSSDYLSEAAKAEWLAAQKDEEAIAGMEDEDEDGDTDSLMEWWHTVEQWDEMLSEDEDDFMKDESKSFKILADKVHRGLRVFYKVFTERAEVLWQSIFILHAIAEDIGNFHQKAKIAGITGGTTTAVGGVTAIAGLALAPFTFATSLIITAVGVGVATAGGITSASAAISDNVNNMHDRKKVETVLQEYETHLLTIGKILHFINQGLYKLRGHPFLRSGTQHYSEDWEIRRAVQMISLADSPVMQATDVTDTAVASVQALFKDIDQYFIKDSRELKKGCKKEMVAQVTELANVLQESVVELNTIREQLQEATGDM